ncbi:MAG TPA: DUF5995 family protein [Jatrophihabitans sp.]|nr:DUF5995 family protein [Jatrophihabitans sp.]
MPDAVAAVVVEMRRRLDGLPAHRSAFLATYHRTTEAIGAAVNAGLFEDADWVRRWDLVFAEYYLAAHDAEQSGDRSQVPRPWRLAFDAPADLPALRHVLLGINAHINYDLPQALLAVIGPEDFDDPELLARRRRDHERIDAVLAGRVGAEDLELRAGMTRLDRMLAPLNRRASKRFLAEARQKVWHNAAELHAARLVGDDCYRGRLAELEVLAAARIADLLAPGQVLLRLAVAGFGVLLPPPRAMT